MAKVKKIPFVGNQYLRGVAHAFLGVGSLLQKLNPYLDITLKQSGITQDYKINTRGYIAVAFLGSLMMGATAAVAIYIAIMAGGGKDPAIGLVVGALIGCAIYVYMLMIPKSIVNNRVKYLDRNLLFALRSLLIQIRSGVPIFNAIASVASGDYGPISSEFKQVVDKVNSGAPVVEVLEELAVRNPSIYFRRALWQLVNSMKSGSDVGTNLAEIIASLSKEQLIEVHQYKSTLNPLAMMYMMVAVIMPSLGITLLIILSTFPGMESVGNPSVFWGMLVFLIFMQFIFMGIIKSKRPNLIGG
ncbi:Type II secretion system (T2SS), protein F [uncultured archaeon]|nr:Type II secretion system (T2SS), protein F [uncultured archaeon]